MNPATNSGTGESQRLPEFEVLASDVRACRRCEDLLPMGPRPVVQLHPDARILIAGQAPGRRVHETGIPFNDPSGVRLRDWLGIDDACFYDPQKIALLPMGFCFSGTGKSGDLPPRPECADTWRKPLLAQLPNVQITLLLGRYAIDWHLAQLGRTHRGSVTSAVATWREFAPALFLAPHPSPRNQGWLKRNSWFATDLLPELQARVQEVLSGA